MYHNLKDLEHKSKGNEVAWLKQDPWELNIFMNNTRMQFFMACDYFDFEGAEDWRLKPGVTPHPEEVAKCVLAGAGLEYFNHRLFNEVATRCQWPRWYKNALMYGWYFFDRQIQSKAPTASEAGKWFFFWNLFVIWDEVQGDANVFYCKHCGLVSRYRGIRLIAGIANHCCQYYARLKGLLGKKGCCFWFPGRLQICPFQCPIMMGAGFQNILHMLMHHGEDPAMIALFAGKNQPLLATVRGALGAKSDRYWLT